MDNIDSYFNGEKLQCLIGAIFSVICIAASAYFLFLQKPFLIGMAYTIMPLSILLLSICTGVIFRVSKDIERVTTFQRENSKSIQTEEIPRMEKVMKSFGIIKKVELVLFIIGLILIILYWGNELIRGVAIGLVLMGISLYAFDNIAESRGKTYVRFLKSL